MKVILALLALSCSVFAMPDRVERDAPPIPDNIKNSCVGQCVFTDKYREWFMQALPKAREFGKQLSEQGNEATQIVPALHPEKWDQVCTEVASLKTCVAEKCASDAEKKQKAEAVLTAVSDIVCDAEIKAKFPCIQEVAKTPPTPPACDNCAQYKAPILEAYNQYKTTGQRDWEQAKTAGKNACLLVNCRLKCRKNDIEAKCQADGFAAAKKLVKELAVLAKTAHAQFRPAENFPSECNPDNVIQGA